MAPFSGESVVIIIVFLACTNLVRLGAKQSGKMLEIFDGQSTLYKQDDRSATIQFKMWPSEADIFYISCNWSASFDGKQKAIFRWENNKIESRKDYTHIVHSSRSNGRFSMTINQPNAQKEGCFFCKANTHRDNDVKGVAGLSRKKDHLEQVIGSTIEINQSNVFLPWIYYPKKADIVLIKCYYQPTTAIKTSWTQIYQFDRTKNTTQSMGTFTRRVTHKFNSGQFVLRIHSVTNEEEGTFDCEFTSEGSDGKLQTFKTSCSLVPAKGENGEWKAMHKEPSPLVIALPIGTFIIGCLSGIVCPVIWRKREKITSCFSRKCRCKKSATKEKQCSEEREGLAEREDPDSPDFSCDLKMKETPRKQSLGKKQKGKPQLQNQTSKEQQDIQPAQDETNDNQEYVAVVCGDVAILLYLEGDGTLSLETLRSHFPGATGLTQEIPGKGDQEDKKLGLRCKNGKLFPPRGEWGNHEFRVVCPETPERNMPMVNIRREKLKEQANETRRESHIGSPTTSGSLKESTPIQSTGTPSPNKNEASAPFPQNVDHPDTPMPNMEDASASGSATE